MTQQQRYRCIPCGRDLAEGERHDCPRLRDEIAVNEAARVPTVAETLYATPDADPLALAKEALQDQQPTVTIYEATTTNGQDQEAGDGE